MYVDQESNCKKSLFCTTMPLGASITIFRNKKLQYLIRYWVKQGNRSFPLFSTSTICLSTVPFAASTYDPGAHPV